MQDTVRMSRFKADLRSSHAGIPPSISAARMFELCMYVIRYVCMYACMYACMYVCICKYVCMNVSVFVCKRFPIFVHIFDMCHGYCRY